MSIIQHYISNLVQQVTAWFPGLPPSLLLFLAILVGFLVLVVVMLLLRGIWSILTLPLRLKRRRRAPQRTRYTPYRMYSTDWVVRERERRRQEFVRRIKR